MSIPIKIIFSSLDNISAALLARLQETFSVDAQNTGIYTIKVLNLGDANNPISPSASISGTKADYFGNIIDKSVLISNTQKQISGAINSSNDIDFIKFKPTYNGDYTFNCISINNISAVLYDNDKNIINTAFTSYKTELTAEQMYYIKISSTDDTADYIFTMQYNLPDEAENFNI